MAEHAQMRHPGNRGVRWASVVVFLAVVGVTVAMVWPVVHNRLPFGSAATGKPVAPVPHLTTLHAQVGSTRSLAGASSFSVYAGTLWVTQRGGHGPATVVQYSAHSLKPQAGAITISHAGPGPVHVVAARGGTYVRTSTGIQRVQGHTLVSVKPSAVPRLVLLSLYGTAGFGRAWTVQGHKLYARSAGASAARRVATPFALANVQPVVAESKLWVARAVKEGTPSTAQVQPLTPAGRLAGATVRLGHGRVSLELVSAHRLWVVVTRSGPRSWLYQVNPATGKVIGATVLPPHFVPGEGVASGKSVWLVENAKAGTALRLSLTHRPASS
jgi:hypothetical protein